MSANSLKPLKPHSPKTADSGAVFAPLGSTTSIASNGGEKARERRYRKLAKAKELLPAKARVQVCMCAKHGQQFVEVVVDRNAQKGHVRGIVACGDLWGCPVCAERITAYRRDELQQAIESWQAAGNSVAMLTNGASHHLDTDLHWFLDQYLKASRDFLSGGSMKALKAEYGWVGQVRALEVTYNANGWNPHGHYLIFLQGERSSTQLAGLESALKARWAHICRKHELYASAEHGVKVTSSAESIHAYVAKQGAQDERTWGAADELTRHMHKTGGSRFGDGIQKGFTAWELLSMATWAKDDERFLQQASLIGSPGRAAKLFKQYYAAFSGRNQLVYSRGLRALLGLLDDKTDKELAEQEPDFDWQVALTLQVDAYNRICKRGLLATVIQWCIDDRMWAVRALLAQHGVEHFDLTQYDMGRKRQ